jgi:hypothetical protein
MAGARTQSAVLPIQFADPDLPAQSADPVNLDTRIESAGVIFLIESW